MNKNNIIITIKKELRSIFRDRKTMLIIFGFPFLISLFVFFYGSIEDMLLGTEDTKYSIGVNYELNSSEKTILDELNLEPIYYESVSKMKEAYENQEIETYIVYEKEEEKYVIYTDDLMSNAATYASAYLDSYNKYLGDLYLKGEDIDPEIAYGNIIYEMKTPDGEELSTAGMMIDIVINLSFTYIIAAIALATANMATSALAVEKENGTLETILTMPITIKELITGKYIATVIIGFFASIVGFIITLISFAIASSMFEIYDGFSITVIAILLGIIICFIASLLIGGLAILVTSSAKSYKEAQASSNFLQIVCLFPIFLSLLELKMTIIFYLVPVLSHTTILMDLYSGNINYLNLFICIGSTIVYTVMLLICVFKKFKSEKVLFGA